MANCDEAMNINLLFVGKDSNPRERLKAESGVSRLVVLAKDDGIGDVHVIGIVRRATIT